MRNSRAFTLVELLVVIAIIALLISILAPSLNAAKNIARQAMCATTLRGIGSATVLYAETNKGRLPPFSDAFKEWDTHEINAGDLIRIFKLNGTNPPGTANDVILSWPDGRPQIHGAAGFLWVFKFLDNAGQLFCAAQRNGMFMRSSYPDPYPSAVTDAGSYVMKISYAYNVNLIPLGSQWTYAYKNIGLFPSDKILAVDTFHRSDFLSHTYPPGDSYVKVNAVYSDTHVVARTSVDTYKIMTALEPGDSLWYNTPSFLEALKKVQGN